MIKIGVIGCGYWGKNHVRVLSELPCQLVGVADKDETKKSFADEYNIAFYTNYRKLLKTIDAIVIVTPPDTHYQMAKEALNLGLHVFVEKPFTKKIFQAQRLVALSRQRKKILMVGHIFMYSPAFEVVKRIVKSGGLGELYYLYSRRVNFGILRSDVNALENFGPHDFSIIMELLGKPRTIRAIGKDLIQDGIEDVVFLYMQFAGKVTAHVHVSWLDPLKQRQMVIVGSRKMLLWDDTDLHKPVVVVDKAFTVPEKWQGIKSWETFPEFKVKTIVGEITYPRVKQEEPLIRELSNFLDCIEEGKRPISDGTQGLAVTELITLAQRSLKRNGKMVKLDEKN